MDLCNELCSSHRQAVLRDKNFQLGHYTQTIQPNLFMTAIFIGTTDFYHFIPRSLTLTLPRGSQGQRKAKPSGFVFCYICVAEVLFKGENSDDMII